MKLVLFAEAEAATLRARADEGARLLLWDERAGPRYAGLPCAGWTTDLAVGDREAIDAAAIRWTKDWGRRALLGGRPLRDAIAWKDVSLWWFAELYLHHSTESPRYVRVVEAFHRLLERVPPDAVEAIGLSPEESTLLARTCDARGLPFAGSRAVPAREYERRARAALRESRWNTAKAVLATLKAALLGGAPTTPGGRPRVLFLSHAAFWRERAEAADGHEPRQYEHYFGALIPALGSEDGLEPFVLGVGPRAAFRRRGGRERLQDWLEPPDEGRPYVHANRYCDARVLRAVLRATGEVRAAWRLMRKDPEVARAFSHRGVSFADLAAPDLAGTLLLQLPWAVRSYEEMASALRRVRPRAVCLYAESSGWGRAAVAACRAAGVPTIALQHGILYPGYYSYLHDPDEADCPRPDRTAVFGEAARRMLVKAGGYAPESLVVTGSPKFDALVAGARAGAREAARARLGIAPGERLVVVASRFRPIRATHQAIGTAFPALVHALGALPGVRALVKPHPAEPADAYRECLPAAGAMRTAVAAPSADLVEMMRAADALVTVESLSAVEALVLGLPVVVLNMPTNLREMVEAGAALGVPEGDDPGPALHAALFDEAARERLRAARARYVADVAMGADGRATERILALLRETAGAGAW